MLIRKNVLYCMIQVPIRVYALRGSIGLGSIYTTGIILPVRVSYATDGNIAKRLTVLLLILFPKDC